MSNETAIDWEAIHALSEVERFTLIRAILGTLVEETGENAPSEVQRREIQQLAPRIELYERAGVGFDEVRARLWLLTDQLGPRLQRIDGR